MKVIIYVNLLTSILYFYILYFIIYDFKIFKKKANQNFFILYLKATILEMFKSSKLAISYGNNSKQINLSNATKACSSGMTFDKLEEGTYNIYFDFYKECQLFKDNKKIYEMTDHYKWEIFSKILEKNLSLKITRINNEDLDDYNCDLVVKKENGKTIIILRNNTNKEDIELARFSKLLENSRYQIVSNNYGNKELKAIQVDDDYEPITEELNFTTPASLNVNLKQNFKFKDGKIYCILNGEETEIELYLQTKNFQTFQGTEYLTMSLIMMQINNEDNEENEDSNEDNEDNENDDKNNTNPNKYFVLYINSVEEFDKENSSEHVFTHVYVKITEKDGKCSPVFYGFDYNSDAYYKLSSKYNLIKQYLDEKELESNKTDRQSKYLKFKHGNDQGVFGIHRVKQEDKSIKTTNESALYDIKDLIDITSLTPYEQESNKVTENNNGATSMVTKTKSLVKKNTKKSTKKNDKK